jgi:hypothetical protein
MPHIHIACRHGLLDRRMSMAIQNLTMIMIAMACHEMFRHHLHSLGGRQGLYDATRKDHSLLVTAWFNAANKLVAKISHQPAQITLL